MPRASRLVVPGLPHHLTQRGVRSADIFADDLDRELYLSLMRRHAEADLLPCDPDGQCMW